MPILSRRLNRPFTGRATSTTGWCTLPTLSDQLTQLKKQRSVEQSHKRNGSVVVSEAKRLARGHGDSLMKAPAIPIPFHKLLKVVAIVDREAPHIKGLLDRI